MFSMGNGWSCVVSELEYGHIKLIVFQEEKLKRCILLKIIVKHNKHA